jgi:hypothetical protein
VVINEQLPMSGSDFLANLGGSLVQKNFEKKILRNTFIIELFLRDYSWVRRLLVVFS